MASAGSRWNSRTTGAQLQAHTERCELVEASPLVAGSLLARFASHQGVSPAVKAIAALRNQFDGHAVKKATDVPSPHSSRPRPVGHRRPSP